MIPMSIVKMNATKRFFFERVGLDSDNEMDGLYQLLYEHYLKEMPYGVASARTGDPYSWISEKFEQDLEDVFYPKL